MLFDRHFGQALSLSSPRSTCSWNSWPHAMQRNDSIVASASMGILPAGPYRTAAASAASDRPFGFRASVCRA